MAALADGAEEGVDGLIESAGDWASLMADGVSVTDEAIAAADLITPPTSESLLLPVLVLLVRRFEGLGTSTTGSTDLRLAARGVDELPLFAAARAFAIARTSTLPA